MKDLCFHLTTYVPIFKNSLEMSKIGLLCFTNRIKVANRSGRAPQAKLRPKIRRREGLLTLEVVEAFRKVDRWYNRTIKEHHINSLYSLLLWFFSIFGESLWEFILTLPGEVWADCTCPILVVDQPGQLSNFNYYHETARRGIHSISTPTARAFSRMLRVENSPYLGPKKDHSVSLRVLSYFFQGFTPSAALLWFASIV